MTWDLRQLATVQVVPPTPFTADSERVVEAPLEDLVRELYEAGMRVFLPAAGTGEFHSLTADEIVRCVSATRRATGDSALVVAPVGFGLPHARELARRGADEGADALLLMPPVHPYLSDSGFRDYFDALAKEVPLPFLAYKRGPVPSDRLLIELGREGRLVGVKYAVNDLDAVLRFAEQRPLNLGLYCGTAERFAPFFMMAGAQGYTSGIGNLFPRTTLALHAALARGDYAQALDRLRALRPVEDFRAREGDSFNISAIKAALALSGRDFGPPRPPQRRLSSRETLELGRLVEESQKEERRLLPDA